MIYNKDTAARVAGSLLQIKAIKLNTDQPFTWASGLRSPIYCDNRKALSFPKIRTFIRQELAKAITDHFGNIDVVAGVVPHGVVCSELDGLAQAFGTR